MSETNPSPRNGRFPIAVLATDEWRSKIIGRILVALSYTNFSGVVKGKISDIVVDPGNPQSVIITIDWSRKQRPNPKGDLDVDDKRWNKKEHGSRDFSVIGSSDTSLAGLVANLNRPSGWIVIRGADGGLFRILKRRKPKK